MALLRGLAERGLTTFTTGDAREVAEEARVAPSYVGLLLNRLARGGWVRRIKRGTYALSTGLTGFPEAHPFAIGMALVDSCAVSGWAALNYHGLTDQIPQVITLTTPRRVVTPAMRGAARAAPSTWEVAGQRYEIVTVVPAHFFGYEEVWMGESRVRIFDRERALLDSFALPRRFGGLGEGLAILEEHLHEIDVRRLVAHALRYGKVSVARRLGWSLDQVGAEAGLLEPLRELPVRGYRLLDPTRPARGSGDARWGVLENLGPRRAS